MPWLLNSNSQGELIWDGGGWRKPTAEEKATYSWPPVTYRYNTDTKQWIDPNSKEVTAPEGWVSIANGVTQQVGGKGSAPIISEDTADVGTGDTGVLENPGGVGVTDRGTATPVVPVTGVKAMPYQDPMTVYRQSLGLGQQAYQNPYQTYLAERFPELQNMYNLLGRMTSPGAAPDYNQGFTNYAQGLLGSGVGGGANAILQSIFKMDPSARAEKGLGFERTYNPETGGFAGEKGQAGLEDLALLIRSQMARTLGPEAAGFYANRLPQYEQRWRDQNLTGTTPFVDYLKNILGY